MFLDWAATNYQDSGFPTTLTVKKIAYTGNRKKGRQQKQRAFTNDELKRLFEGPEMKAFADDPEQAYQFWFPHIGLFSGARINEICQINPQTDIRKDPAGIWFFLITEDTEGHEDIVKSVKTNVTREVPIHKKLLEIGILAYVDGVKATGSKLLFPKWEPKGGRAAPHAGDDFVDLIKRMGIHGTKNEKGFAIHGMHAFRHTILSYGKTSVPKLNLRCITGHKERSDNEVADGYEDGTIIWPLAEKKRLLDLLDYGLALHTPASGTPDRAAGP
jgi:integrase